MTDAPSRTSTNGCDCLNDCGDDPRVQAGSVRRCDWGAHWKAVHDARTRLNDTSPQLLAELQHVVHWFDQLTAADIERYRAVIAQATGSTS